MPAVVALKRTKSKIIRVQGKRQITRLLNEMKCGLRGYSIFPFFFIDLLLDFSSKKPTILSVNKIFYFLKGTGKKALMSRFAPN